MSEIVIAGNTSGSVTIAAPDVAGTTTLTLPATSGNIALSASPQFTALISGSGTYTVPAGTTRLSIKMIGGGAGGAGGGNEFVGVAGNGGNTTFGSLLIAYGAPGASTTSAGGTGIIYPPAIGIVTTGNAGQGFWALSTGSYGTGGIGGASQFGGCGIGNANSVGIAAIANSGAGGGGGGFSNAAALKYSGAGGGAGGYIDAIINNPASSYSYTIGAGGTGGIGSGSGYNGAAGGSGIIYVTAYFN